MSWSCTRCTFLNDSNKKSCEICETPAPVTSSPARLSSSSSSSPLKWACNACTFLNSYKNSNCEICSTRSSTSLISTVDDLTKDDSASDVGSVFFPLRRCTTKKVAEHVNLIDESDKNGKKDEVPNEFEKRSQLDGICGSKRAESSKGVYDEEKPVSKRKRDLSDFFDKKAKGKAEIVSDTAEILSNAGTNGRLGTIKILTYNVWFREDLEMFKRMEAIGDLVDIHAPDVICFQEVMPEIFTIFERSSWWKRYRCSTADAFKAGYYCIQLTKLPVKSFHCHPFSNSIMGRELITAEVDAGAGKSMVVATSHLESPCPGPPKYDQMYSKERVEQAKEAFRVLQKYPNVIFCGDMNWDDKLDGQFPCPEGWVDAWARLRPGEVGYTYDTKTNKMLSGNRTLQKRLDRFICNLRDFKISEIEMIGTEEIPGLSYCKEKKVKGTVKQLTLPVLPSDHYGLLLTITRQ